MIKAEVPDDVAALAREAAALQNQTLDQFVVSAITKQITKVQRALTVEERSARGDAKAFRSILDRVPSGPPVPGDER